MKNAGKTMHVFTASLAFLNKATLTKHRILRCESYSFICRVVASFSQKTSKNGSKIQATFSHPQNTKKWIRGTCFGFQNGPELTSEIPKIHKMPQKSRFLTLPFFEQISRREKMRFCSSGTGVTPRDAPPGDLCPQDPTPRDPPPGPAPSSPRGRV